MMRQVAEGRFDGESADVTVKGQLTDGPQPRSIPVLVVEIKSFENGVNLGRIALGPVAARHLADSLIDTIYRLQDGIAD